MGASPSQSTSTGLPVSRSRIIPLSTTAKLNTAAATPVGTLNVQSQTKIRLNPIVSYISIGYRF